MPESRLRPALTICSSYLKPSNMPKPSGFKQQQWFILHFRQGWTRQGPLCSICLGPKTQMAGGAGDSEKVMAPHSRTLAWKIPWAEEPGGLQSMGWLRVGRA